MCNQLKQLSFRLEAATSRLEDIASSTPEGETPGYTDANGTGPRDSVVAGATSIPGMPLTGGAPSPPSAEQLTAEIEDYDTLINGDLATFVKLSESLDPLVGAQVR